MVANYRLYVTTGDPYAEAAIEVAPKARTMGTEAGGFVTVRQATKQAEQLGAMFPGCRFVLRDKNDRIIWEMQC